MVWSSWVGGIYTNHSLGVVTWQVNEACEDPIVGKSCRKRVSFRDQNRYRNRYAEEKCVATTKSCTSSTHITLNPCRSDARRPSFWCINVRRMVVKCESILKERTWWSVLFVSDGGSKQCYRPVAHNMQLKDDEQSWAWWVTFGVLLAYYSDLCVWFVSTCNCSQEASHNGNRECEIMHCPPKKKGT